MGDADPIVALDWPRPDFRLGSLEFLIGLLATACPPADDDDGWANWWETPPPPQALSIRAAAKTIGNPATSLICMMKFLFDPRISPAFREAFAPVIHPSCTSGVTGFVASYGIFGDR